MAERALRHPKVVVIPKLAHATGRLVAKRVATLIAAPPAADDVLTRACLPRPVAVPQVTRHPHGQLVDTRGERRQRWRWQWRRHIRRGRWRTVAAEEAGARRWTDGVDGGVWGFCPVSPVVRDAVTDARFTKLGGAIAPTLLVEEMRTRAASPPLTVAVFVAVGEHVR